jgi:glycosyltransferase involved in cell wall biosynthesis
MFRFGFVFEHVLGHITHYQNLRHWVAQDPTVTPNWMLIQPGNNDIWERFPLVRANWSLQASLRARDAMRAALRVQSFDALFLHTQSIALFALGLMHRIPTIISTDATPLNYDSVGAGYRHKVGGNPLLERQKFLWNQRTYQAASAIVTWSQWAKNSVVNDYGIPADKVTVSSPGIDLEQWAFKRPQLNDEKPHHSPVRLLFVGGDFIRKGGQTLVEAFQQGLHQNCVLDIVTKDVQIFQALAGAERIQVHCHLSAGDPMLKELYAKADIFIFPTQSDCHSVAITEAMAAGLPIITTNVGAIHELVEHGTNGWVIPASDVESLVAAVTALVADESKRRSMAIASRCLAEERFDGRRNYSKILSLMKQVIARKAEAIYSQSPLLQRR